MLFRYKSQRLVSPGQLHPYIGLLCHLLTHCMAGTKVHEEQAAILLPGHPGGVQPWTHPAVSLHVL